MSAKPSKEIQIATGERSVYVVAAAVRVLSKSVDATSKQVQWDRWQQGDQFHHTCSSATSSFSSTTSNKSVKSSSKNSSCIDSKLITSPWIAKAPHRYPYTNVPEHLVLPAYKLRCQWSPCCLPLPSPRMCPYFVRARAAYSGPVSVNVGHGFLVGVVA
jgi:hypothetical protein